jgi:hypothetical protein
MSWEKFIVDESSRAAVRKIPVQAQDFMAAAVLGVPAHSPSSGLDLQEQQRNSSLDSPYQQACDNACEYAARAISLLQRLDARHKDVSNKTSTLHSTCRTLADSAQSKKDTAKKVGKPLSAFDSYYVLGLRLKYKFDPKDVAEAQAAATAAFHTLTCGGDNPHGVRIPVDPLVLGEVAGNLEVLNQLVSSRDSHLSPSHDMDEFAAALDRMDECVASIAAQSHYKESAAFLVKLRHLQLFALHSIRDCVFDSVSTACNSATERMHRDRRTHSADGSQEAMEMSNLHLHFRTSLSNIRRLLILIEARAQRRAYAELLKDCYAFYASNRGSLVSTSISTKLMEALAPLAPSDLPVDEASLHSTTIEHARSVSALMARTLLAESSLFSSLFVAAPQDCQEAMQHYVMPTHVRAIADAAISSLHDDLCSLLVDSMRSLTLSCHSVDTLCGLVNVLKDEVMTELANARGPQLAALGRAAGLCIKDLQERLAFLANTFVSERIEFRGTQRDHVHYALSVPISDAHGHTATLTGVHLGSKSKLVALTASCDYPLWLVTYYLRQRSAGVTDASCKPPSVYDSWFPALEQTLMLLSKLYRVLEQPSFETLAQDAVAACTAVLMQAKSAIAAHACNDVSSRFECSEGAQLMDAGDKAVIFQTGLFAAAMPFPSDRSNTSVIDADLFLIKNLLVLREQLSPFEVQLTSTSKSLDFSSTTEALSTLLSRAGQLFAFSRENPFLSIVVAGLPRVAEKRIDCKLELESFLKASCDQFIQHACTILLPGIAAGSQGVSHSIAVDELSRCVDVLRANLPVLRRKIGLYLGSSVTSTILFKPIRDRLSGKFDELASGCSDSAMGTSLRSAFLNVLLQSDQLVVDPLNINFGFDTLASTASSAATI